jgi:hypothetical protein
MLYPQDGAVFDMLSRFIDHEYDDPKDMEIRGLAAGLGIQGKLFSSDEHSRKLRENLRIADELTIIDVGLVERSQMNLAGQDAVLAAACVYDSIWTAGS